MPVVLVVAPSLVTLATTEPDLRRAKLPQR
jgi:hypothetical protein